MTKKWKLRLVFGLISLMILSGFSTYFFIKSSVVNMYGLRTQKAELSLETYHAELFYVTNVNVLTPSGETYLKKHAVGIKDGEISVIINDTEVPVGAKKIDGNGNYLIPGFTDSHIHLWRSENDLLLYLANGVTQIREMHGIDLHLKWKSEIQRGRLGPDMYISASQLATYGFFDGLWQSITSERNVVASEGQVHRRVRTLKAKGYDAVKASSFLSSDGYEWASDASKTLELPFTGHIPLQSSLKDLWASEQKEVAHIEEFVKALNREFGGYRVETADAFLSFVKERSSDVAKRTLENGIYVTSTLTIIESIAKQELDVQNALKSAELTYVNPGVAEGQAIGWLPEVNRYKVPDKFKVEGWEERHSTYWSAYVEAQRILFKAFKDEGVRMMVGTDANVPVIVPGFSLHNEMEAMQELGMNGSQILASATSIPAEWMNWQTGQIRIGYKANLVLLREDPLADINASRSIEMVFINGHVLDRSELDEMLESVRVANNKSRKVSIAPYIED